MKVFTFQYGQIYYYFSCYSSYCVQCIYIPIWLDLLYSKAKRQQTQIRRFTFQYGQIYYLPANRRSAIQLVNLHSNMVRFIIISNKYFRHIMEYIYIPIWLDLLLLRIDQILLSHHHLHSNMVRFIIRSELMAAEAFNRFTFQYGQIYY